LLRSLLVLVSIFWLFIKNVFLASENHFLYTSEKRLFKGRMRSAPVLIPENILIYNRLYAENAVRHYSQHKKQY
jgi:hypothetical protein